MQYPEFLKEKNTVGVCAMSSGVGHKIESFNESIQYLQGNGFHILETKSVRNSSEPSNVAFIRVEELNSLIENEDVSAVWLAAGGDFQYETLPYLNFEKIQSHPKWILGASDPTNLLFPVTCLCDIATIYGFNAGSFDAQGINEYSNSCIDFLKGKNEILCSSKLHQHVDFYNDGAPILNTKTKYIGEMDCTGRLLGGCFESIHDMAGTPYDFVKEFQSRYKKE